MENENDIIRDAAEKWACELHDYIIPGTLSVADRENYEKELFQLEQALKPTTS